MAISAGKLAPSAAVLAFVGYCAWPSLCDLVSDPPKTIALRKLPELAAALFSPKMPPPPTTNPWGGKDITSLAAAREAAKAAELAGGTAEKTPPPAEAEAAKNVDPLRGLKLDATLIVGGKRLAVINGRFYGPQQRLHAGGAAGPPFTVVSVLPYEVRLERGGKTVALTYPNAPPRPPPMSQEDGEDASGDVAGSPRTNKSPTAATGALADGKSQTSKAGK